MGSNQEQQSAEQQEQHEEGAGKAQQPPPPPEPKVEGEEKFIKPEDIVAHLDAQNAERDAQEPHQITVEAPVSAQYSETAGEYAKDGEAIALAAGIPIPEMQTVFNFISDLAIEAVSRDEQAALMPGQFPGPDLANRQACETTIHRRYGNMASEIIRQAQEAYRNLPKDVQRWLDHDSGDGRVLTNHPAVIAGLALWRSGYSKLTPEAAEKELKVLRSSKTYLQGDNLTKDKIRMLGYIAARGKSGDANIPFTKPTKGVPATAKAKVEAKIKDLRTHPAYFDRNHASHKEVVAQVSELYGQLGTEGSR